MSQPPETFTIGALAEAAGVNVEMIRFYQRKGLMSEPDRPLGSIRRYAETDIARVRFIKAAQRLGFSLDEMRTCSSSRMGPIVTRRVSRRTENRRTYARSWLICNASRAH